MVTRISITYVDRRCCSNQMWYLYFVVFLKTLIIVMKQYKQEIYSLTKDNNNDDNYDYYCNYWKDHTKWHNQRNPPVR